MSNEQQTTYSSMSFSLLLSHSSSPFHYIFITSQPSRSGRYSYSRDENDERMSSKSRAVIGTYVHKLGWLSIGVLCLFQPPVSNPPVSNLLSPTLLSPITPFLQHLQVSACDRLNDQRISITRTVLPTLGKKSHQPLLLTWTSRRPFGISKSPFSAFTPIARSHLLRSLDLRQPRRLLRREKFARCRGDLVK